MKSVIVTGSSGAIGRATTLAFRREGYRVIGVDVEPSTDVDVDLRVDLRQFVRDEKCRSHVVELIREATENAPLYCLVNNAAVQRLGQFDLLGLADWEETLHVNLLAPFFLTQAAAAALRMTRGSVVNVASIHAQLTKPGFVAYATSKGALVAMTRALAIDLAPHIRVNAVLPAAVETEMLKAGFANDPSAFVMLKSMHPLERIATVDEVAEIIVFLASAKSGFVSGAAWGVDGGIAARLHDPI